MSNYKDNKNMGLTMHHHLPKILLSIAKKSPVEDEEIEIIGTRPETSKFVTLIGRKI